MIYEVEGDIMLTRAEVIAHGVTTTDPMIRGLAHELHKKFPAMVEAFQQWCGETNAKFVSTYLDSISFTASRRNL